MDETEKPYKPSLMFLAVMWGGLTILGGIQGYFTADAIHTVMGWLGYH